MCYERAMSVVQLTESLQFIEISVDKQVLPNTVVLGTYNGLNLKCMHFTANLDFIKDIKWHGVSEQYSAWHY